MRALDAYNLVKDQIFKEFGYTEDWKVHPLEDMREVWWAVSPDKSEVHFFYKKDDINLYNKLYSHEIGHDRFLPKYIYEGSGEAEGYTMILCDTHTDGNVLLCIFDDKKKCEYMEDERMPDYADTMEEIQREVHG